MHLGQPRVGQVPALDPRADQRGDHPVHPVALPGGRRGVDDLLHVPGLDVLARHRADDRGGEPLAQPPLGVGVLAGPPVLDRQPVGVQVMGDQVRAGPLHVGRVGCQPLGDLLQLCGQLLLGRALALLPLAVLVNTARHGPRLSGRVDRNPVLQLDHRAGRGWPGGRPLARTRRAPGGRPSPAAAGRAAFRGPVVGILWGSWPAGADCAMGVPLFLRFRR